MNTRLGQPVGGWPSSRPRAARRGPPVCSTTNAGRRSPRPSCRPASGGPRSRPFVRRRGPACAGPAVRGRRRSGRTARDGQGTVPLDDRDPERRRSRPARTAPGPRRTREDPLHLTEPVRRASPRDGRGSRAAPRPPPACDRTARRAATGRRRRRPGGARSDAPARPRVGSESPRSACRRVSHAGRSMGDHITGRPAGRPPHRSTGRRAHDRDPLEGCRQPGRRPDRHGRLREGGRLPAPQRHRPRRVLGRQRPPGRRLLPRPVGLHARSPSAASRPRSATGPATSWSRTTSGSCSPRR